MKTLFVPYYDTLTVDIFMEYAKEKVEPLLYLPDGNDYKRLPREYIINVIYSTVGDPFKRWVMERVNARNNAKLVKEDHFIEVSAEVMAAFNASSHKTGKWIKFFRQCLTAFILVADGAGRTAFMLQKSSNRRRTQQEIKEAKEKEQGDKQVIQALEETNQMMNTRIRQLEDQMQMY
jgi:hypothetical protein